MSRNQFNIKLTYSSEISKAKSWFFEILIIYIGILIVCRLKHKLTILGLNKQHTAIGSTDTEKIIRGYLKMKI